MKKIMNIATPKLPYLKTLVFSTLVLFAFSCQNDDMDIPMQEANSVALYEILEANTDGNSNKTSGARQGSPKKGEDPIALIAIENGGFDILKSTPFGNSIVADFAIEAIDGEQLGQDDNTDVLAISFSAEVTCFKSSSPPSSLKGISPD